MICVDVLLCAQALVDEHAVLAFISVIIICQRVCRTNAGIIFLILPRFPFIGYPPLSFVAT